MNISISVEKNWIHNLIFSHKENYSAKSYYQWIHLNIQTVVQRKAKEKTPSHSYYEASILLIPKPNKGIIRKEL